MIRPATRLALTAAALAATAGAAQAGAAPCWFENNVVVVSGEVMGVIGDFVLDTATPQTVLADSEAQAVGIWDTRLSGEVWLAGVLARRKTATVETLDLRTGALPTVVSGVIGADVLKDYVLDVSFQPCRIRLSAPGKAPPFRARARLPMTWVAGRPVVGASVADGPRAFSGAFAPAIGADTAIRFSDTLAHAPGAAKPKELYPYGVLRPKLRALSLAGVLWENLPAGLVKAEDPGLAGQIGTPVLARYRLRFDFPRGELLMAPAADTPKREGPRRKPRP
ncbi:hypothetical protein [Phenylobacterium sp.]|uniref:hypothetical protein n=1 Tax=Phenylobacterium sp. TaxID=1871053 RepID=UPI001202E8F2|nr:hypothetical protein [Phenylobacterium sp.]THD64338.1 MAG: hypothetical protein E8A49_02305 [Phenylobacterium sp.]